MPPGDLTELPAGPVELNGRAVSARSLTSSAIALVPANCGCGAALSRLAGQAAGAHVSLYFAGSGQVIAQLPGLVARYGDGTAVAAADSDGVLTAKYHPAGLTVLLVFRDATAEVLRSPSSQLPADAEAARAEAGGRQPQRQPARRAVIRPDEIASPAYRSFRGPIAFLRPVVDRQATWLRRE